MDVTALTPDDRGWRLAVEVTLRGMLNILAATSADPQEWLQRQREQALIMAAGISLGREKAAEQSAEATHATLLRLFKRRPA